jgi:DNA-binding MarR family transcriptional regulator
MDKDKEFTKKVFEIISRFKHADVNLMDEADNDIRPSEEMLLIKINMLSDEYNVKVNDIVNTLKFAPSTVSTILKALEDNGYVIREVNKDNRREVFVKITDKGKLRLETAKKRHFNTVRELINYLGEDDATKLIEILERTAIFFEEKKKERENNHD